LRPGAERPFPWSEKFHVSCRTRAFAVVKVTEMISEFATGKSDDLVPQELQERVNQDLGFRMKFPKTLTMGNGVHPIRVLHEIARGWKICRFAIAQLSQ
jgi:hypothetical protein